MEVTTREAGDAPAVAARPPGRLRRLLQRGPGRLFLATVVLPTLLAALHFGLLASDVYLSESRFLVRSPQRSNVATGLGALLQGTAFARAQDDTYSVHDYVRSRDALALLEGSLGLRAAYSAPELDWWSRFPGFDFDDSLEALYRHHLRHLQIDYDPASSITVLTVRAYSAQAARDTNEKLLALSEQLLNQLNERSRRDLIAVAEREVREAEARAADATEALARFRSQGAVIDPMAQSSLQLQAVAQLEGELRTTQAQLDQLRRFSPANPQVATLTARVAQLRQSIAAENARVTGERGSLNAKAGAYNRLVLAQQHADRALASTLAALDTARNEAQRKHLYLERLVQPNLPDHALEPRRWRSVFMVALLGAVLWGVLSLVLASVREHTD